MVFNVIPTAFEIALVAGILSYQFGPQFAVLVGGTVGAYTARRRKGESACVCVFVSGGLPSCVRAAGFGIESSISLRSRPAHARGLVHTR